ncbi:hypothetical protein [Paraburkholderia sp. BCC1885]|uniref:hypothetical protein n=1 Tax=Paraburkholderia sp. BCC1885 TaxID=2562669 RepID=UPI001182EF51|nr:hypothetical protein [Paraburkholderia sp. BCC1885]
MYQPFLDISQIENGEPVAVHGSRIDVDHVAALGGFLGWRVSNDHGRHARNLSGHFMCCPASPIPQNLLTNWMIWTPIFEYAY